MADLEALSANSPSDATFRRALATARADRADVLASQRHLPEALRDFDQAIVAQTSIAGADPTDINAKQTLVSTQERRALALARNGHARAALGPLQEAARTRDQLLRDRREERQPRLRLPGALVPGV